MADNTLLNTGTGGDVIASDDIAGVKHQMVKIEFGALDTATLVSSTNPLPVGLRDTLGQSTNSAATGFLKVSDEPHQMFYDSFDAALDTTNMWTSTQGSSGVAAAVALGVMSMGTGTVASGYSKLISIPTFKPSIPGWMVFSDAIQIPDAAAPTANALRLWGLGTTPATPTAAAPITDGYFFELSTAGVLSAVVYAGGTRTVIATTLTLATTYQRYIIQVRTDRTFFFIGTIDSAGLVATTNFQSPQAQILPKLYLAVGGATPPATNSQILSTGAVVSDTGKNSIQLSDGTFSWRKATITVAGALKVDGSAVTQPVKSVVVQTQTSNLTAASQAQTFTLQGEAGMSFNIAGTWVGTISFEASNDNFTTFSTINAQRAGDNTLSQTVVSTAGNDLYRIGVSGFLYVRARMTAYTSGTATVIGATALAASTFVLTSPVTQGLITKATQGTTGVTTQDLKDAGRVSKNITLDSFAVASTAETLNTTSLSSDNGTVTTGTSQAVTAAKRFRMQQISAFIHTITGNTTAVNVIVRVRVNNGGVAIVSSPVQFVFAIQGVAAANQAGIPVVINIPDGYELVAGAGIGVTTTCSGFVTTTAAPKVDISITGYEY